MQLLILRHQIVSSKMNTFWFFSVFIAVLAYFAFLRSPTFPRDGDNLLANANVQKTFPWFLGPESLAFDPQGRGPYTGVGDGRIVRWDKSSQTWNDFALTSPNRDDKCKPKKPPVMDLKLEPLCGRPLGLRFDKEGNLYVADAYYGLGVVGPEGGSVVSLVKEADGLPLGFTNDVDIDDGTIYFTDSSSKFKKFQFVLMYLYGDDSGRLLTYDISSKEVKVILQGLHFPNGIALSQDKSYLLICETLKQRVLRYWLRGPAKGTVEEFCKLPGYPDNIRLTNRGDFWVVIHAQPNWVMKMPRLLRRLLLKLPVPFTSWYIDMARKQAMGMVVRVDTQGHILQVLEDQQGKVAKLLSGVEEKDGVLWLGSVILPQIVQYQLEK